MSQSYEYRPQDSHMLIPPPTHPSSHCATLTELPDGKLLAAWYAGSKEGARDVAIFAARYDGTAWSEPYIMVDTPDLPDGNPLLFLDPRERLWLLWDVIEGRGWKDAQLWFMHSLDGGKTWSRPRRFAPQTAPGWMVRNKPLLLNDGTILLPLYDERAWQSFALLSADGGESWEKGKEIVTQPGNIQMTAIQRDDGSLFALLRSARASPREATHIWQATSTDGGHTWQQVIPTSLPHPNSGIDMVRLVNGHLLLVFNNTYRSRTPLTLALSTDEGRSWQVLYDLEDTPGEYSYPAIIQTGDGRVHILYTYRRECIKHVII